MAQREGRRERGKWDMRLVRWAEPRPGMDADGTEVTANVTLECTEEDAIRMMRKEGGQDEDELLGNFLVIHWTWLVAE